MFSLSFSFRFSFQKVLISLRRQRPHCLKPETIFSKTRSESVQVCRLCTAEFGNLASPMSATQTRLLNLLIMPNLIGVFLLISISRRQRPLYFNYKTRFSKTEAVVSETWDGNPTTRIPNSSPLLSLSRKSCVLDCCKHCLNKKSLNVEYYIRHQIWLMANMLTNQRRIKNPFPKNWWQAVLVTEPS